MGSYHLIRHKTVEESLCISLKRLREWGYLKNRFHSGRISWSNQWGEKFSVSVLMNTEDPADSFLNLNYTITERDTGEKKDFDYKVKMIQLRCNYGGGRWWFLCPYENFWGLMCGKKVYKLYLPPRRQYFGCRHCHNLTYSDRQDHNHKYDFYQKFLRIESRMDKIWKTIKRYQYAGEPTKRYQRYLKYEQLYNSFPISEIYTQMENL